MARRFAGRAVGRGPRRTMEWIGQETVGNPFFGAVTRTAAGLSGFPIGIEATIPFTVTRIILDVLLGFRAAAGTGQLAVCYVGIIIVSAEAFGAGAGSIPDPRIRQSDDWLYLGMHTLMSSAVGFSGSGYNDLQLQLDLKGQRKMSTSETLLGVFALDGLTGASRTIQAAMQARILIKRP